MAYENSIKWFDGEVSVHVWDDSRVWLSVTENPAGTSASLTIEQARKVINILSAAIAEAERNADIEPGPGDDGYIPDFDEDDESDEDEEPDYRWKFRDAGWEL